MIYSDEPDNIPDGVHRCMIISARKDVSKAGRDMIRMSLDVYGYMFLVKHYIVFIPERSEIANEALRSLFASCPEIEDEFDLGRWAKHELACEICHEDFNGMPRPKVARFVPYALQGGLPHYGTGPGVHVFETAIEALP